MRTRWGAASPADRRGAFPALWGSPQLGLWGPVSLSNVRAAHGISALQYQWVPAGGEAGIETG